MNSFTTTAQGGLLNALKNDCGISSAWNPSFGGQPPPVTQFRAIWDTGATNSVITQTVIDIVGLAPTGMASVSGVHGVSQSETYLVNIALPNNVLFMGVRVTKGVLTDADLLVGMDIISRGDFAVTNFGGITKFSFRCPSEGHIDFVQEHNKKALIPTFQHGGKQAGRKKRTKPAKKKKR